MQCFSSRTHNVVVAVVRSQGAIVKGQLGNTCVEVMLDSGSSISLIKESLINGYCVNQDPLEGLNLVSAAGEPISVIGKIMAPIQVGNIHTDHSFIVVRSLITSVILGMDFLQKHGIVLDFTTIPVTIKDKKRPPTNIHSELQPILEATRKTNNTICAIAAITESDEDIIDDCAVPLFNAATKYEMPDSQDPDFKVILEKHKELFCNIPGKTTATEHYIPTTGNPVKIPPRRIPANYRAEVEQQISSMLQQGIIEVSSSPWMAPAVFVRKKIW